MMSTQIVNCSSVASLMESEAREKTHQLIARISEALLARLNSLGKDKLSEQTCEIEDANLLRALPKESDHYDIINSLLTCQMIIKELFADSDLSERAILNCYETTTQVLENFTLLQRVSQGRDRNLINKAFTFGYDHLDALVSSLHSYPISLKNSNKKNSFVDRHLNILQQAGQNMMREPQRMQAENQGFIRQLQLQNKQLHQINTQLKQSLNKAEKQLVQVQLKLITILNQRQQYEQQLNGAAIEQLKQQLAKARMEIDRMDQQFRIQINKYNEVFRSMEGQIRTLREYHNIDVIQDLQTEIVRLREERERDDIIINELKERERELKMELNRGNFQSPRQSGNPSRFKHYQIS